MFEWIIQIYRPGLQRTMSRSQRGFQQEVWAQNPPRLLVFSLKVFPYQLVFIHKIMNFVQNKIVWHLEERHGLPSPSQDPVGPENMFAQSWAVQPYLPTASIYQLSQTKLLRLWFWYSGCEDDLSRPFCLSKLALIHRAQRAEVNMKASRQKQALFLALQDALEVMFVTAWVSEWLSPS